MKQFFNIVAGCIIIAFCLSFSAVTNQTDSKNKNESMILGFGILERLPGLWNGPVQTTTPAGNFKKWYVDFRPVSAAQVSQYTDLDSNTINYTSFFVVKYGEELKVAMRTEGVFMNKGCVTYEVIDSVNEEEGYYRFSDFQAGAKRAYTEFFFKKNKMEMITYTNKFNQLNKLEMHSKYVAKLVTRDNAKQAIEHFNFPQPEMVKDFSDAFKNMDESIYFTFENDPYPSKTQPYVGTITVNIKIDESLKLKDDDELFLLLTTESLFEGLKYDKQKLNYISKHAYLPVYDRDYTFTNVHPGKYFLYSYNDINGDKRHLKGDYMSSDLNNVIELPEKGEITVNTKIDFVIP